LTKPMAHELILIVEDDDNSRKLLRDLLAYHGYGVLECGSGEESIRLALEFRPALILMDIHLPGISGIEALHKLRQDPATRIIPVMAVTASVLPDDRSKVLSAGFDGYQRKPISTREFVAAVKLILDRPTDANTA
jgi:two-component system, cell cycle response regulator DivK